MAKSNRRNFLVKGSVAVAGVAAAAKTAKADEKATKKVHRKDGKRPEKTPLFSGIVSYGNLVFIAGIGAHFEGDIKAHTKRVLDEIQKKLEEAGSSMEKVLKVNVYLNDLKDYDGMNEMFRGRFGPEPPVRTTIAAAGGIPGNSLVEIDCIAVV
jgi:2-iminobutanoate/2-iminopropanoate deaminase